MSDQSDRVGNCLCGAVRLTAKNVGNRVAACHCAMCRRWGGGPFMELNCGTDVEINGVEKVRLFNSSEWAERGFCSQCGTHLFYRLKEAGEHMVPVGLFKDQENLVFENQVFIDEKPAFYSFANQTHDMTGAEIFAKYGA